MKIVLSLFAFAIAVLARDVPDNVRAFVSRVRSGKCTGGTVLKDGFYSQYPGSKTFAYCQDNETDVIYLHGTGSKLANMDIDCDGDQSNPGDGRCGKSKDTQSITAFQYQVQQYSGGQVSDLNANFIPYVVFGNYGSKSGYTTFHPQSHGIKPLSVMAVIYKDTLLYGVYGDENGDDGPPLIGEASISLATQFFGTSITGNNGHNENDVCTYINGQTGNLDSAAATWSLTLGPMYIAFPGTAEATVNKNADWGAKSFSDFEASIKDLGDQLIQRLR